MLTSMQVLLKIWCPASNSVHRVKQHTLCQWAQPTQLRNLEREKVNELSLNPNWKYFLLTAYLGTLSKISFPMGGWMNRYKGRGKILGTKRHTFLVTTTYLRYLYLHDYLFSTGTSTKNITLAQDSSKKMYRCLQLDIFYCFDVHYLQVQV